MKKTTIELFCFDKQKDYLPHHKNIIIKTDENETWQSLFQKISSEVYEYGYLQKSSFSFVVNGKFVDFQSNLQQLLQDANYHLCIEPLSSAYAIKDLIVDVGDFEKKFSLIGRFFESPEYFHEYQKTIKEHFAMSASLFEKEFVGGGVICFVARNIEKLSLESKVELLKVLSDEKGIWLAQSLKIALYGYEDQDKMIANLKKEILSFKPDFNDIVTKERKHMEQNLTQCEIAQKLYKELS